MKGVHRILSVILISFLLCACGGVPGASNAAGSEMTWQDYYDLGVRYLSEGNYEEAIIAFTAAIEIDPARAAAYEGRGDAYLSLESTEENQRRALEDYLRAIECDDADPDISSKIADIYISQGNPSEAIEVILSTYDIIEDGPLKERIFDLFDTVSVNQQDALMLGRYILTDETMEPAEWTINGRPLWEAGPDDFLAILGDDVVEWNGGPYVTSSDINNLGGYGSHARDIFMVNKDNQEFEYSEYRTMSPECRGIEIGMPAGDCLSALGVSSIGVEYLLERVLVRDGTGSIQYVHLFDGGTLWFHADKYYAVDGLQWYLTYIIDDEAGGERHVQIAFVCDENDSLHEIYCRYDHT